MTDDPQQAEPFGEVCRIGWELTRQRYRAQDWCQRVRGEEP
jgi:hypothetical protein